MNRSDRRKLESKLMRTHGYSRKQAKTQVDIYERTKLAATRFKEGDKVKLNKDALKVDNSMKKDWCDKHINEILTVKKDEKYSIDSGIWTLEECEDVAWLFTASELIKVNEGDIHK